MRIDTVELNAMELIELDAALDALVDPYGPVEVEQRPILSDGPTWPLSELQHVGALFAGTVAAIGATYGHDPAAWPPQERLRASALAHGVNLVDQALGLVAA